MEVLVEDFWKKLEGIFQSLAAQLLFGHEGITSEIGCSSNTAFPLRAFLTILRSNDGDELSFTVDIKKIDDGLLIESDVVGEDGVIVADGPALELYGDLSAPTVHAKIDKWFASFECFIKENSSDVDKTIKRLL